MTDFFLCIVYAHPVCHSELAEFNIPLTLNKQTGSTKGLVKKNLQKTRL